MTITNKVIRMEYTKKVGFIIRINIKISSAKWYKEYIEEVANILKEVIKVRKEIVYQ